MAVDAVAVDAVAASVFVVAASVDSVVVGSDRPTSPLVASIQQFQQKPRRFQSLDSSLSNGVDSQTWQRA